MQLIIFRRCCKLLQRLYSKHYFIVFLSLKRKFFNTLSIDLACSKLEVKSVSSTVLRFPYSLSAAPSALSDLPLNQREKGLTTRREPLGSPRYQIGRGTTSMLMPLLFRASKQEGICVEDRFQSPSVRKWLSHSSRQPHKFPRPTQARTFLSIGT